MKQIRKIVLLLLAVVFTFTVIGCDKDSTDKSGYTLRDYLSASPAKWSPHTWETNGESYMLDYTEMGLIDISMNATKDGYEWVYEMATSVKDVTATYADYEKWGVDPAKETGRIWEIKLNESAVWADGKQTPINADTYIYSMQQLLNPEMKNYRANNYFVGDAAIYNAEEYYYHGEAVPANIVVDVEENGTHIYDSKFTLGTTPIWFDYDLHCTFFGPANTTKAYADAYKLGQEIPAIAPYLDGERHVLTETLKNALNEVAAFFEDNNPEAYMEMCHFDRPMDIVSWADVGLVKGGDYTLYYITKNEITEFYFYISLTSNWIVYEELYEKGKNPLGNGLISTDYGTSLDAYMSYGPYKLTSFEKDKQFALERNTDWYGWKDGKHVGQYQTTAIVCDIISEHDTQILQFEQGGLDSVSLTASDLTKYRLSENLLKTDQTYTQRIIFNTDYDKLKALENSATQNKVMLSYIDFRHAFSLAINRSEYATRGTAGHKPAYGLINSLYYYNVEEDPQSVYRNTDEAKMAVLRVYGLENSFGPGKEYPNITAAYNAITGYDLTKAKEFFQKAYTEAKANGDYNDNQTVEIEIAATVSALSEDDQMQQTLFQTYIDAATQGTGFAGKVKITLTGNHEDRYKAVANGQVTAARGAWGGAAYYPFSLIRCYTDPGYAAIHEASGFDPTTEQVTMTFDFTGKGGQPTTITQTYQWWAKSINSGGAYNLSDLSVKLFILSELEYNLLSSYHFVILSSFADVSIYSHKISYATNVYNIMYGYGGIRLMTYNYNDEEWDKFVKDNNNQLDYQ